MVLVPPLVPSDVFVTDVEYGKVMAVADTQGRASSPPHSAGYLRNHKEAELADAGKREASDLAQGTFRGLFAVVPSGFAFLSGLSSCASALAKSAFGDSRRPFFSFLACFVVLDSPGHL